jgi:mono/diheme cytochrome c family protein
MRGPKRELVLSLGLVASLALGAAAVAQDAPAAPSAGAALFVEKCGLCHLEGGFGTRVLSRRVPEGQALLQARQNLPAAYVTAVVRRGIGSMPQIRPAELGDEQLAMIARYLETKR